MDIENTSSKINAWTSTQNQLFTMNHDLVLGIP